MPMNEISDLIPIEKRPTIIFNGSELIEPKDLKSLKILHPALGLDLEIGAHPSDKFAAIGIRMNKIHWYTIYFTLAKDVILVGMMESKRSVEQSTYWTLVKQPNDIAMAEYALPDVDFKIKANAENHKEIGLKVKKFDLPETTQNINPELFLTDEKSGIRFRCIRIFNLPLKMNVLNAKASEFIGKTELSEKIQDQLVTKQEEYILDLSFMSATQAKLIGDGITKIGIGILEDHLSQLK